MHIRNPLGVWVATQLVTLVCLFAGIGICVAEEPYEKFLDKLRSEGLYDLALIYLNELDSRSDLPAEFRANLALERGLLQYQSAAMLPTSNPNRGPQLDEAEKSLRTFLSEKKNHPRRGEARLKIGELLMQRADEAKQSQSDSNSDNADAIRYYSEAHDLFENTISELAAILEKMRGARIDNSDKAAVAYRQKLLQDVRQAQILSAKAVEERGRSRADNSVEQKKDLQTALKMFADLYSKAKGLGPRNVALFYRSAIQATLGQTADAIDGFQRVADVEGVQELHALQSNAVKELVVLLAQQGKYPLAVDRADKWLSSLSPPERSMLESMQLRLQLAKTKIEWSEKLRGKDPQDRVASKLIRNTRDDLRSMLRVQGNHLEETRQLLSSLGVGKQTDEDISDDLPEVASFAEAMQEAQDRIDRAEDESLATAIMRENKEDTKAEAAEQKASAFRQQAMQLLHTALHLYNSEEDTLSSLEQARFSLAYLHLKEQEPMAALAIAELIAVKNPRTDIGLRAAAVALGGLSDLLRTAGEAESVELTAYLEPFAKYLIQTWPDSQEAASAASALVQLALMNEQWEQIDQFVALAPKEGETAVKLRRDVGVSFYARYLDSRKQAGETAPETQQLKKRAMDSLEVAVNGITPDNLDSANIQAINSLARLYLTDEKTKQAAKLLLQSKVSPLKAIQSQPDVTSEKIAMNSYRTAIQLSISQLAQGITDSKQAISETSKYIGELQKLASKSPGGAATLSGIFVALAKDLKDQLAATQAPQRRKQLSEAMVLLAKEAASAESFNTQFWAADTIASIAEEMEADKTMQDSAQQAYANAAIILDQILKTNATQPGFIEPASSMVRVQLLHAKAMRGKADFSGALKAFVAMLTENAGLLEVQIEAARTLQAIGDNVNAKYHKAAYLGSSPDKTTRQNRIWGWGKIAQIVKDKQEYQEQFFLARYELARSRYKHATSLEGKAQQDEMKRAVKDVVSTATFYPELGGPTLRKKFDSVLKAAQKALGESTTGLAGLK